MNWLLWIGLILATARVTRLLVVDEFPLTKTVREWMLDRFGVYDREGELVGGRAWPIPDWGLRYVAVLGTVAIVVGLIVGGAPLSWLLVGAIAGVCAILASLFGSRRLSYSIAYLWGCPWCMSFWVAWALIGVAMLLGFSVPLPWLLVAIASYVSGILIAGVEALIDRRLQ